MPGQQLQLLRARAAAMLVDIGSQLQDAAAAGMPAAQAWNSVLVQVAAASHAHCTAVMVHAHQQGLASAAVAALPAPTQAILKELGSLSSMEKPQLGDLVILGNPPPGVTLGCDY